MDDLDFTLSPAQPTTVIQFGCNSPLELSRATLLVAPYVNGVDINCGCPQSWACAEKLGAALMHERELVADMVRAAKGALGIWVFMVDMYKFRKLTGMQKTKVTMARKLCR